MTSRGARAALGLTALLLAGAVRPAGALTLLTAGKVGRFRSAPGSAATALVRVTGDPALRALRDPTCPATSSVRLALSRRGADFEDHREVSLPCAGWRARGRGYRWTGTASGVGEVVYAPGRLVIRAGGPDLEPVAGPVAYVEAWLTIAGERHLIRFHTFRQNDASRIVTRRPSRPAAAGEAAFWDTLWADWPRSAEALTFLRKAVRRDPHDGRSQFLLAMLHLYRSGEDPAHFDFTALGDAARAELRAAQEPFDRAVALLPLDTRVPGFRAAATYADGFVHGDPARTALGLARLDETIAVNPIFDSFDLFAVVAPVVPGSDPYYQTRILALVDLVLKDNLDCPFVVPELCSNVGMAPHNIEGTFLLLGDIYAKGGRVSDAILWYGLAQSFGRGSGYRFQAIADDRVAQAAQRVALYQDADPTNDPPLVGGGGAACIYCHNK